MLHPTRRHALVLLSTAGAALLLFPARLFAARPAARPLQRIRCTFCGVWEDEYPMLGAVHGSAFVCEPCIQLAVDILEEQDGVTLPKKLPPPFLLPVAVLPRRFQRPAPSHPHACSFCQAHPEQRAKIIAGPLVYICELCALTGDALLDLERTG